MLAGECDLKMLAKSGYPLPPTNRGPKATFFDVFAT